MHYKKLSFPNQLFILPNSLTLSHSSHLLRRFSSDILRYLEIKDFYTWLFMISLSLLEDSEVSRFSKSPLLEADQHLKVFEPLNTLNIILRGQAFLIPLRNILIMNILNFWDTQNEIMVRNRFSKKSIRSMRDKFWLICDQIKKSPPILGGLFLLS